MGNSIVMSSGHSLYVRGANGFLDEVNEARNVVHKTSTYIRQLGSTIYTFHDNTSRTKNQNLKTIVNYHNSKPRELDVSIHFNSGNTQIGGVEVCYISQNNKQRAASLSKVISTVIQIPDRGAKYRDDLYFLNETDKDALLIEICFVNVKQNADSYHKNFDALCRTIAEFLTGKSLPVQEEMKVEKSVSAFALDAYEWVKKEGISDGSRPQDPVTRQEMWVMLYRLSHPDKRV